ISTIFAYTAAILISYEWSMEAFRAIFVPILFLLSLILSMILLLGKRIVNQVLKASYYQDNSGRLISKIKERDFNRNYAILLVVISMIFFIDSLGFLKLIEIPDYL